MKSLDSKLKRIKRGQYTPEDFIIADAKDGDMAFGVTAPGPSNSGSWKPRAEHLNAIEAMCKAELIDIMLMSVSSAERIRARGTLYNSRVTPAVRLNDTTDIWCARQSSYRQFPSRPFATTDICTAVQLCDLGLYSMTFSNDLEADLTSLQAYKAFRAESREHPMRHFLEVFNPAFDIGIPGDEIGFYINDMIIKAVAGLSSSESPLFLKIQYNGSEAMEELARYDPESLIVGILGGSAGTTRDTFELALQAEQAGARVALFGRKINLAENPLLLVELLRQTLLQKLTPAEAVKEYHRQLNDQGIAAKRKLEDDLQITEANLSR